MGEEAGLLDDVADAAAERERVPGGGGLAADADGAGGGHDERVHHAEEGGFAAAAAAEEGGDGAGGEREGDVLKQGPGGEGVADGGELDCGFAHGLSLSGVATGLRLRLGQTRRLRGRLCFPRRRS